MKTATQNLYELMVICSGDLGESDFVKEFDAIAKLVKEHGEVLHKENWGVRKLPVKIKKFARGYFGILNFSIPAPALKDIRDALRINTLVLRSLIMVMPPDYKFGSHTDEVIPLPVKEEEPSEAKRGHTKSAQDKTRTSAPKADAKPIAPMSQEEQKEKLKKVEKKLEDILDNPDLDI